MLWLEGLISRFQKCPSFPPSKFSPTNLSLDQVSPPPVPKVLHRVLGVLHRVLGVGHGVRVLHRVLGVLHAVLGVLHRVPVHSPFSSVLIPSRD